MTKKSKRKRIKKPDPFMVEAERRIRENEPFKGLYGYEFVWKNEEDKKNKKT